VTTTMDGEIADHFNRWAPHFDADHDPRWSIKVCEAFHEIARRHGANGWRLLDLGCGTGTGSLGFADLGYEVTACDIASEMLHVARAKPGAERVRFVAADLCDLPDLGRHDVVVSMNDPFSHVLTDDQFTAALRGVARSLAPGGVFVFDQHPLEAYRAACDRVTVLEGEDHVLIRRVSPDRTTALTAYTFRLDRFTRDPSGDVWRRTVVSVRLRHRHASRVARLVTEAGLSPLPPFVLDAAGRVHAADDVRQPVTTLLHSAR
jgi:2-polyprenyl-3-methyl-5-hydroxy-6-metoxy-1,4-benzoquinol methylase